MQLPVGIKPHHLRLLGSLAQVEECKYTSFRSKNNTWRHTAYFDGEIKWLTRRGLVLLTISRTIQITEAGKEVINALATGTATEEDL